MFLLIVLLVCIIAGIIIFVKYKKKSDTPAIEKQTDFTENVLFTPAAGGSSIIVLNKSFGLTARHVTRADIKYVLFKDKQIEVDGIWECGEGDVSLIRFAEAIDIPVLPMFEGDTTKVTHVEFCGFGGGKKKTLSLEVKYLSHLFMVQDIPLIKGDSGGAAIVFVKNKPQLVGIGSSVGTLEPVDNVFRKWLKTVQSNLN